MDGLGTAVVIEDDTDVRNLLTAVLVQAGFEVHAADDGWAGVEMVREKEPRVVTLDIGMPGIDGFEVLRRLRQFTDAYVVMLTGRTGEADLLTALQAGADDYITKPFRPREVRARILTMLRRPRVHSSGASPREPAPEVSELPVQRKEPVLRHNGLVLDFKMRTVQVAGVGLELTRSEFDLLHELLRAPGAVRSRRQLVQVLRGEDHGGRNYVSEADEKAVEAHIGNLRRKLRDTSTVPRWIQTVRGAGYCLARAVSMPVD